MAFKLFGGSQKKPNTPNGALEYIINACCDGNVVEIMDIFQIGERYRSRIMGLPGVVRGYLGTYGKKLFKQSKFEVGKVERISEKEAVVEVSGKTFDGVALADVAVKIIAKKGGEIGLFSGNISVKNVRLIGKVLGMVDDILHFMKIVPTKGTVTMVLENGEWQVKDADELTMVLARAKVSELAPAMKEKLRELRNNA